MGRHVAGEAPELDALVDEAIRGVGAEIDALRVPRLFGVVLGGGYGRGEGGAIAAPDGTMRLSNDLDFYVVAEDGASAAELAAIGDALAPVAERWTARLGVDADFCPAKTPWRLRHDQDRVMVQELVRGHFDVAGAGGEALFAGVERREASELPWMEAARLLMNRGVGLLLALEARGAQGREGLAPSCPAAAANLPQSPCGDAQGREGLAPSCLAAAANLPRPPCGDAQGREGLAPSCPAAAANLPRPPCGVAGSEFIVRNINKCVLGAGDARLIAHGRYAWRILDRAEALGDPLYREAAEWKFRPRREGVCGWEEARRVWLDAADEVFAARGARSGRSLFGAARWVARRRTLGDPATFGLDPVERVLRRVRRHVEARLPPTRSLLRDWEVFN